MEKNNPVTRDCFLKPIILSSVISVTMLIEMLKSIVRKKKISGNSQIALAVK